MADTTQNPTITREAAYPGAGGAEPEIARLNFEEWPPSYQTLQPMWMAGDYELTEAWSEHERNHDPPIGTGHRCLPCSGDVVPFDGWRIAGRAVAWAWYKRRHRLQSRLDHLRPPAWQGYPKLYVELFTIWPRCLIWTDEIVVEVENWNPGEPLPEALTR